MTAPRVLINGGGVAGLTTALSLARKGVSVKVFENRAEFSPENGRALVLMPKSQSILNDLGVEAELDEAANPLQKLYWMNQKAAKWHQADLNWIEENHNKPLLSITHNDLHSTLLKALPNDLVDIEMGVSVESIEEDENGVTVKLCNGAEEKGDVLVAADGPDSSVRQKLFGPTPIKYSGRSMFWGHNKFKDLGPWREDSNEVGQRFGKGGYFAHIPLKNGDVSWFMAIETEWATEGDFVAELPIAHYQEQYRDLLQKLADVLLQTELICKDKGIPSFRPEFKQLELSADSEQWGFDIESHLKSFYQLADFELRDQTEIRKAIEEIEWSLEQAEWVNSQIVRCNSAKDIDSLEYEYDTWTSQLVIETEGGAVRWPRKYGDTRKDSLTQRLFFQKDFDNLLQKVFRDRGLNPLSWSKNRNMREMVDEIRPLLNAIQVKINRLKQFSNMPIQGRERYSKKYTTLRDSVERLLNEYTKHSENKQQQSEIRVALMELADSSANFFENDATVSGIEALCTELDELLQSVESSKISDLRSSFSGVSEDEHSALKEFVEHTYNRLSFGGVQIMKGLKFQPRIKTNKLSFFGEYQNAVRAWNTLNDRFPEISASHPEVHRAVTRALKRFSRASNPQSNNTNGVTRDDSWLSRVFDNSRDRLKRAQSSIDLHNTLREWEKLKVALEGEGDESDLVNIPREPYDEAKAGRYASGYPKETEVVPDIDWRNKYHTAERTWVNDVHYVKSFECGESVVHHNPDESLTDTHHLNFISESAVASLKYIHGQAQGVLEKAKSADQNELSGLYSEVRELSSQFLSTFHKKKMNADHKVLEDLGVELQESVGDHLLENWERIDHQTARQMVHDEVRRHWAYPVEPLNLFCENFVRHDIYDREPLSATYNKGRVVCIGDSAHALPAWFLLGPNLAVEDASLIAETISNLGTDASTQDVDTAFQTYFNARHPHLKEIFQQKEKVEYSIFTRFQPVRWMREWEMAYNGDKLLREFDWHLRQPQPSLEPST